MRCFGVSQALVVEPQPFRGDSPGTQRIAYDFVLPRGARGGSGRVGSDPSAIMPVAQ
jgi:hypothetical protein